MFDGQMGRSSIAVSDEIASQLSKIAEKEDKTSYAMANECLREALRICEKGGRPDEIYGAWIMNRIGKDIGVFQFMGRDILEEFARDFANFDRERFAKMWYKAGFNFGVYLQMCFPTIENLWQLANQLEKSFTSGKLHFIENDITTAKTLEGDHQSVSLHMISPYSEEFLAFITEYWKGLCAA